MTSTSPLNGPATKVLQQQLFQAIEAMDITTVEGILQQNSNVARAKDDDGVPAIIVAVQTGNPVLAGLILKAVPDVVDMGNANDSSAVMFAAMAGDIAMLKLLDQANADLEHCNVKGVNALMSGARKGQREAVKFLSDAGVELGRKDKSGLTAADHAREGQDADGEEDEVLAGAIEKEEIAQRQVRINFFRAIESDSVSAVALAVLQHKAAPRWRDLDGMTGLMRSAQKGQEMIAKMLIAAAPNKVDEITPNGSTAFLFAAFSGHIGIMQRLEAAGANTRHKNREQKNALMFSAANGQADAVTWLATQLPPEKSLDFNETDAQGLTAPDYARRAGPSIHP
jgi:ankyrin repeat protein